MQTSEDRDKILPSTRPIAIEKEVRAPSLGWMEFLWVPLLSFAVFHLDAAAYYLVLWWHGVPGGMEGLMRSVNSGAWLYTMLPWTVLIFALHAISGRPRARAAYALAPPVAACFLGLVFLAMDPPIPWLRFERETNVKMPAKVANLRCVLSGVSIHGWSDWYSFTCPREETERLIREMKLTKYEFSSQEERDNHLPTWREVEDCHGWPGVEMYGIWDEEAETTWHSDLATDATHTKVVMGFGRL